jgi:hypothetical protein
MLSYSWSREEEQRKGRVRRVGEERSGIVIDGQESRSQGQ